MEEISHFYKGKCLNCGQVIPFLGDKITIIGFKEKINDNKVPIWLSTCEKCSITTQQKNIFQLTQIYQKEND